MQDNSLNDFANRITNNVVNTYSKVFGNPYEQTNGTEQPNNFDQTKSIVDFPRKKDEPAALKGTNEKIKEMSKMLSVITDSLSEKNTQVRSEKLDLEKISSFFKNNDEQSNQSDSLTKVASAQTPVMSDAIPEKEPIAPIANVAKAQTPQNKTNTQKPKYTEEKKEEKPKAVQVTKPANNTQTKAQTNEKVSEKDSDMKMPSDQLGEFLKKLSLMESLGNPNEKSKVGSASGMFQFTKDGWKETIQKMGKNWKMNDRFDPKKSAEAAEFATRENEKRIQDIKGEKATEADLYASYMFGPTGSRKYFNELKNNPSKTGVEVFGESKALKNKGIFYKKDGTARTMKEIEEVFNEKLKEAAEGLKTGIYKGKKVSKHVYQIKPTNKTYEKPKNKPIKKRRTSELENNETSVAQNDIPSAEKEDMEPSSQFQKASAERQDEPFDLANIMKSESVPSREDSDARAEMEGQPKRQIGNVLADMSQDHQRNRDEMSGQQAPVINNISNGGSNVPPIQSSGAQNAMVAGVRNDESSLIRMQNRIAVSSIT